MHSIYCYYGYRRGQLPGIPAWRLTAAVSPATAPENILGMNVENITPALHGQFDLREKTGVVVTSVTSGSPAGTQESRRVML